MEYKVKARNSEHGFNDGPVVEETCKELGKKYKNRQQYVLNPNCHSKDSAYFLNFNLIKFLSDFGSSAE